MKIKKNLFSRLVSYTPRDGGRPAKENFFTELIAFIMEKEPAFLNKFFHLIECEDWQARDYYIKTQYTFNKRNGEIIRSDIVIKCGNEIMIIENKIDSKFDEEQIKNYLEIIKDESGSKVLSITKEEPNKLFNFQGKFQHLYWFEIYKILKEVLNNISSENIFLIKETMKFMEDENMAEFNGFNDSEMGIWTAYMDFSDKLSEYLEQLKLILKKRGYKLKNANSEQEMFSGFWVIPSKKDNFDDSIWIGVQNCDFEEDNFRLYCGVQVASKKDLGEIEKKLLNFKKSINKGYIGIMHYKPLMSIIGDKKKEEQLEELNKFFLDGLEMLEKNRIWEIIFN